MIKPSRFLWLGLALPAALGTSLMAWGASVHRVDQYGRQFMFAHIEIARGDSIHFVNDDPFLHQIYVYSKTFTFDSDEQQPGQSLDVSFPVAGTFEVQCHIHPTMHLTVNVK